MPEDMRTRSAIGRPLLFLGALALTIVSAAGASDRNLADEFDRGHTNAASILLNTTVRTSCTRGSQPRCFKAYIPSGILELDAAVPGQAVAEPRLTFHGRLDGANGNWGMSFTYLERSASNLLLEIRIAGNYHFCVTAQDPTKPLDELKLRISFVEMLAVVSKGGDPEVDELPPDPKVAVRPAVARQLHASMCQLGELDDHGDTPSCATPVVAGRSLDGEIGNGWGDDADTFALYLDELGTVRLETTGETDTFGGLYDRRGYRIAMDDNGGSSENFRIVKTLTPGLYFVRVEGHDKSVGPYQLNVEAWR